jgi:flagellar biosynthesis protein FlhA
MDGASKFVRGDAIASLLILLINLIGGISIGVFQHGMSLDDSATTFSILTIGDGLVAQIPALLLSIAAAMIVTRVSNDENISDQTVNQMFKNTKPLIVSGVILTCIALIPNMPHTPLLSFAFLVFATTYLFSRSKPALEESMAANNGNKLLSSSAEPAEELSWNDVMPADRLALEIGYGLIHLVGVKQDGSLIARIKGIRKKISQELGFLVPSIRVKDNLDLPPNHYLISIKGVRVSETSAYPDKLLAISSGEISTPIQGGIACKEPTFNLDGYWISEGQRDYAQGLGYTVVDLSTVIATHLNHVIRSNAAHIFGYGEVQELINHLMEREPKLAESLTSGASAVPMNTIVGVLQKLLQSGIPLVDFRTIAEKMVDSWSRVKDPEVLVESVRTALKQLIVYSICGNHIELPVAVIDNELTQVLLKSIQLNQTMNEKMVVIEPTLTDKLFNSLLEYVRTCEVQSLPTILLLNNELRSVIEKLFKPSIPNLHFLSHLEIPDDKQIKIIQRIGT